MIARGIFYCACALAGWWISVVVGALIDRTPPISYTYGRAMSATAEQGGQIDVQFTVDRKRICRAEVSRAITDDTGTSYRVSEYAYAATTRPGSETYDRTITVPTAVPPGRVYYQIKVAYFCNWVHNLGYPITVFSPRVYFTVTEKKPP